MTDDSQGLEDIRSALSEVNSFRNAIHSALSHVIVGQHDVIDDMLAAILCGGHCLLEGVPGLAKTLLVRSLALSLRLEFGRIQFTPDLMPADITGTDVLDTEGTERGPAHERRHLRFLKGPIFNNVVLADEINRASPKTQSALLEAMQETQVTIGGIHHPLPRPFFVLATRNPIEQEGTYPLPEGQLDRFMSMLRVTYPSREDELEIVRRTTENGRQVAHSVISKEMLARVTSVVFSMPVAEHVLASAIDLVRSTRPESAGNAPWVREWVRFGCGPRASQFLVLSAKAHAALGGRPCVEVRDVMRAAPAVLRHRLVLSFAAEADNIDADTIISRLVDEQSARKG